MMERERYPAYKVTITGRPTDQGPALHQESYHLVIHEEALRLQHLVSGDVILQLPYTHIRKYMVTPNTFSIEAGRMCILGEGVFRMETFEGEAVLDKINKRKEITMKRRGKIQNRQRGRDDFYSEPYSLDTCNKGIKATEVAVPSEDEGVPVYVNRTRSPSHSMEADRVTVVRLTEAPRQHVDTTDTGLYLTPTCNRPSGDYMQLQTDKLADVTQTGRYANLTPTSESGIYLSPIHSNRDKTGREETRFDQVPATAPRQTVHRRDPNMLCLSPSSVPPRSDRTRQETHRRPISVSSQTRTSEDTVATYLTPTLGERPRPRQRLPLSTSPMQPSEAHVFSSPTSVQQGCENLVESTHRDTVPSLGRTAIQPTVVGKPLPLSPPKIPQRYFNKLERNDSGTERYVNVKIQAK